MYYTILILIFALLTLSPNKVINTLSMFSVLILPISYLLQNEADILFKIPMLLLLILATASFVLMSSSPPRRTKEVERLSVVLNKGGWILTIIMSVAIVVLVVYDNIEMYERIVEYSELVKKPSYSHLDTLILYSPLVIFSLSGIIIASNLKKERR